MRMGSLLVFAVMVGTSGCFEDINDPMSGTTGEQTTGSSTAVADSGSGDSTGMAEDPCPEYCGLVQDVCTGDFRQYSSDAVCEAVCGALPPGEPDDELGNSVACRRFQAIQASEDPAGFCGRAGPTGADSCGADCEVFCGVAMEVCVDGDAQWANVPECVTDCMQFPTDVVYNSNIVDGDSYACRMYHLTVAALDPGVHCPHVRLNSDTCL